MIEAAVASAMVAWPGTGIAKGFDKAHTKRLKAHNDATAVFALQNILYSIAKKYNIVIINESSEGAKDASYYIPMGTIFTAEGSISPEVSEKVLGHISHTVGEVLQVVRELTGQDPGYVAAVGNDPIEGTTASAKGIPGASSLVGATFYPAERHVYSAKIHYSPDYYLFGYSFVGNNSLGISVTDSMYDVYQRVAAQIPDGNNLVTAFLGGSRIKSGGRHYSIYQDLKSLEADMRIVPFGDFLPRLLASTGASIPGLGYVITTGCSGAAEAALAFKTAMMFKNAQGELVYVYPGSVKTDGNNDVINFLRTHSGTERMPAEQRNVFERLNISRVNYMQQFGVEDAVLPEGAFNVVVSVPITEVREEVVGSHMAGLLPGIQTTEGSDPKVLLANENPADIQTQALVATRLPGWEDGSLFVVKLPYSSSNIGLTLMYDNILRGRALTGELFVPPLEIPR